MKVQCDIYNYHQIYPTRWSPFIHFQFTVVSWMAVPACLLQVIHLTAGPATSTNWLKPNTMVHFPLVLVIVCTDC